MKTPPGLSYIPNYLTQTDQKELLASIEAQPWSHAIARRTQHYGYVYHYDRRPIGKVDFLDYLPEWLTKWVTAYPIPDQAIVNEYMPGQGIGTHIDHINNFKSPIISLSLLSPTTMVFKNHGEAFELEIQPGAMLVLEEDARWSWTHAIPGHTQRRISVTYRYVNHPTR